jgi:hypothetical protein
MRLRLFLFYWLWRQMLPVTVIALPAALAHVLLRSEPLHWRSPWPWTFIFVHSLAIHRVLGRFSSSDFAFLYTRGFSRDQLWSHLIVSTASAVIAVWLPSALAIWVHLRSIVQDQLFKSAYFPVMTPRETWVPLAWAVGYGLFLSTFHYAWIRQAQPTHGQSAGNLIAVGVGFFAFTMIGMGFHAGWYAWLSGAGVAVAALAMLLGGRRLHRRLEVRT